MLCQLLSIQSLIFDIPHCTFTHCATSTSPVFVITNPIKQTKQNITIPNRQHMDNIEIDEWDHSSEKYKTIVSDSDTRNPTTNKKNQCPTRNNNQESLDRVTGSTKKSRAKKGRRARTQHDIISKMSLEELLNCMYCYQSKMQKCLTAHKFTAAAKLEKEIKRIRELVHKKQIESLKERHQNEQFSLYDLHCRQVDSFRKAWNDIFSRSEERQEFLRDKLNQAKKQEQIKANETMVARLERAQRKFSKMSQGVNEQYRRLEQSMVSLGKIEQLANMNINKSKRLNKQVLNRERSYLFESIKNAQDSKLQQKIAKKQVYLSMREKQCRDTQWKMCIQNEEALSRKFENMLMNLKHRQALEMRALEQPKY